MNFRKSAAMGVAALTVAVGSFVWAQDDLDDLLKDLESEVKAEPGEVSAAEASAVPEAPAVEEPAVEEPAAEEPAVETSVAEEPVAEEPAAEEPAAEEPTAEEPAVEESAAEEPAVEEPAPVAEPAVEEPAAEEPAAVAESAAEEPAPVAETPAPVAPVVKATPAPAAPAAKAAAVSPEAELVENIVTTERLRREAFDVQAKREIDEARACMRAKEYEDAADHYTKANKLLNDRPSTKAYRHECLQGVAEANYRAAIQEWTYGSKTKAIELMEKARDMRHPKARRQLEEMVAEQKTAEVKDFADVAHRRNEKDYQAKREKNRKLMRRARQLLAVRDIDGALEECEKVLVKGNDPYNEEALRLRSAILKKSAAILDNERQVAREAMIADVDKAWRPVYAPNASEIDSVSASTRKTPLGGEDPERATEQAIIKRMKEIRLPSISFKPPETIIGAIEYFRSASKDFDRPDIPLEQRGFNFVLKLPTNMLQSQMAGSEEEEESEGFGSESEAPAENTSGLPVIPMITASDISFYEALKLVCDSVNFKFKVVGSIVMVMDKDTTIDEMVTRSYPVLSTFMERMGNAASDMQEMRSAGFGSSSAKRDSEENSDDQQQQWKDFFKEMGVQWPKGSSLMYIKAIGKLRVKNTYENLAELEKALAELNVDQKLIEIEARFVEVEQEDLNSLGFEWILNDNYTIGGGWLADSLGLKKVGGWTEGWTETTSSEAVTLDGGASVASGTKVSRIGTGQKIWSRTDMSGNSLSEGIAGISAFGGTSDYTTGQRYLSTSGNHISGEGKSTNDQFLRVNAFLGNADLSMILHMLSQRSDTDLLNAPKVLTKPGEQAVIKVVTEYIYPTDYNVQLQSSSSSGSYSGGSQSAVLAVVEPESFTMREVGVILDVTPMLTDDGNLIDVKLTTQVVDEPTWMNYGMRIPFSGNSSLQSFEGIGDIFSSLAEIIESVGGTMSSETRDYIIDSATASAMGAMNSLTDTNNKNIEYYDAPMQQPFFHVRSIDSSVSIYPGSTIVMGGLIREERKAMDDKIPFLGDLPFIGRFFRSHAEQTTKRNLLIFLTTRLVDARGREATKNTMDEAEVDVKAAPVQKAE